MKIFLTRFNKGNIPLINKKSLYEDIKKATLVVLLKSIDRPYRKNFYYYDVNYLYPYAGLNPMPGLNFIFDDSINSHI